MLVVADKMTKEGPILRKLDLSRVQVVDACHIQVRGSVQFGQDKCTKCRENPTFLEYVTMDGFLNGYV